MGDEVLEFAQAIGAKDLKSLFDITSMVNGIGPREVADMASEDANCAP